MKIKNILLYSLSVIFFIIPVFANTPLGSYSTKFNLQNTPRVNNLKIATEAINGSVIKSGEIFSYNTAVGPTTQARGFQKSKIFVNGEEKEGYGGGVCQVSSTLYNAALSAGMEIIERHRHSKDVAYIAENKDAATSYGVIDFKFKNSLEHPVKIQSYIKENGLYIDILHIT